MIGVKPPGQCDVDKAVGRIGRRLDEDHRNAASLHRRIGGGTNGVLVEAIGEPHRVNRKARERPGEQRLGAAIERL